MSETVSIRRQHTRRFTIIPNELWQDRRLSMEARGLQGFLLSLQDGWQINIAHLMKFCGRVEDGKDPETCRIGRDKVFRMLRELEDAGWISRERQRGEGGKFGATVFVIRDEPPAIPTEHRHEAPRPENPDAVEPDTAEPDPENADALIRTEKDQEPLQSKPPTPKPAGTAAGSPHLGGEGDDGGLMIPTFGAFWDAYPTSPVMSETAAERIWRKMTDDNKRRAAIAGAPLYAAFCAENGRKVADAATFLKEERWKGFQAVAEPAPAEAPKRVFVIEGSAAWKAWSATRSKSWPTTTSTNPDTGRSALGWWFPSLFPPTDAAGSS